MTDLTTTYQKEGIYLSPEQAERVMELFEEERKRHNEEITELKLAHVYEKRDLELAHLDEITKLELAHNDEKIKICDEHLESISELKEDVDHFYKKYLEANKKCVKMCLVALVEWLIAVAVIIYCFIVF